MAGSPPSKTSRDENLDALQSAIDEWGQAEIERVDNETRFLRQVLQGRTGSADKVNIQNLSTASSLVQPEIDDFLLG